MRYYCIALATKWMKNSELPLEKAALLLEAGDSKDASPKARKVEQLAFDFVGEDTLTDLLDKHGIKVKGKKGGDNQLQKWLREHHPKLVGSAVRDLPKDIKAEWMKFLEAQYAGDSDDPDTLRIMAETHWNVIYAGLFEHGIDKRDWTHLNRKDLERLHGVLVDLKRLIGEALKK